MTKGAPHTKDKMGNGVKRSFSHLEEEGEEEEKLDVKVKRENLTVGGPASNLGMPCSSTAKKMSAQI